ncbi:hypothetical protein CH54_1396 [Yersinia rochesterensis]|uniref:Uncharacterized protein n=1 Tax=Yersinia rochesterensis TaxID=1604335 RepID=A0ABM5SHR6_9GAMM|nr:hypothetical protein [Yersinia rochesterensis]AIN20069.1 hypothetical protein DJ57_2243 [Yersinia rochesterensis]AJI87911.1 hypothetical protein AW19_268 [Yersinia frederiksenii Y225]AJJ34001.1 hypothetical protein CH54_1396 [Yersinia rochesterensis]
MVKVLLLSIFMLPMSSFATVFGGSNLDFQGYPEFTDFPPSPPFNADEYSMNSYRMEVDSYVRKAKEYVENANNDIKRINEASEEAIQKANNVVSEYNMKAQ